MGVAGVRAGTAIVDLPPGFAFAITAIGEVSVPEGMTAAQLAEFVKEEVQAFLQFARGSQNSR